MPVRCAFCGTTADSVEEAAVADWIPSYFASADPEAPEVHDPVCAGCVGRHLFVDPATDEFTARPGLASPAGPGDATGPA